MLQLILTILLFLPIFIESKEHWSYENIKTWPHNAHYCGGHLQSPIDLRYNISHYNNRLKHMYLDRQTFELPQLVNNGHTVKLNLPNHYILKNVASDNEDFIVEQLHFHWGHSHDNKNGSEHLLEGQSYPLEMHIVTYSKMYSKFSEALSNIRGLAVVGVFFELSNVSNPYLEPLVKTLKHIKDKNKQETLTEKFNLIELIGEKRMHRYYRYDGSLTTPPCYESVIWSVLQEPVQLSSQQLHAFQSLHEDKSKIMKNTYRTVQPLGTRKLFRSFRSKDIHDDKFKERITGERSHGQYLSFNIKIYFIYISLLIFII